MSTKRKHIETFRQLIKEKNADTDYTNQYLYNILFDQAKWLIKREVNNGSVLKNPMFFQTLSCWDVIESKGEDCCPVKTGCSMYRTKNKIPEAWTDINGPLILSVTSIDYSTDFFVTNFITWQSKRKDPYQNRKMATYCFYDNGYIWFPDKNPHKVNIKIFAVDDIKLLNIDCEDCEDKDKDCISFLDTEFLVPDWIEAEMYAKALQLVGPSKSVPEDEQIDKSSNRKM